MHRPGLGGLGPADLGLCDPGQGLDHRQGAIVVGQAVGDGQAVDRAGDGVAPAELGPRGPEGHRLPHQFAGIGGSPQQSDGIAGDLAHAELLDRLAQALHEAGLLDDRIGVGHVHAHLAHIHRGRKP
jgi:hypothetical protein